MEAEAWVEWETSFTAFHARFADLFARAESRQQAAKYLRGLLSSVERKNGWQVAAVLGDATPDRMQRLLYRVDWDAEAARDRLQQFVSEHFGDAEGIGVVEETGFLKKGAASVGVQRQYSGTAGKVENCQVATLLSYTSPRGHAFLDRRLYLPARWAQDPARRARAKVPPGVTFQTKPQQAQAMLEHAWAQGVPMRWVTGDEVYGDAPALRAAVAASGRWYVLAVSCTCPVWTSWPAVLAPQRHTGGRPQAHARLAPEAPAPQTVAQVAAAWPAARWQRQAVSLGEKGPRLYDWAVGRVVERVDGLPARESWLLVRRSVQDPSALAYYLAHAPADTPLLTLAGIAAQRYTVEQGIEEAKGEAGLDHYEVRHWPSWYRHVTLALLAHAWLAAVRAQAPVDPADRALGGALRASWPP
jgi:SRSO17 transposase